MQNGMAKDFSWKFSAFKYLELYKKVLAEKQRAVFRGRRSEVRGQRTGDRRQKKEDRKKGIQKKEGQSQIRNPKSEAGSND